MPHFVAIDHGTTFSEVAKCTEDKPLPEMIQLDGKQQMPSVICIDDTSEPPVEVGLNADNRDRVDPEYVLKWYKPHMELTPKFSFQGRDLKTIVAEVLGKIKAEVECSINDQLTEVMVTVPAWFHAHARDLTIEAAEAAGIATVHLENEPTAAAYFCHKQDPLSPGQVLMVYDLGGGTFDTTILEYVEDKKLKVLSTHGDMELGGHHWTLKLQESVVPKYMKEHGVDPTKEPAALYELYRACEGCKQHLTMLPKGRIIVHPENGPRAEYEVTRDEFEAMTSHLLKKTETVLNEALRSASLGWDRISRVLLVGGTTRMPQVESFLKKIAGDDRVVLLGDRDHIVAQGASMLLRDQSLRRRGHIEIGSAIDEKVPHSLSTWVIDRGQLACAVVLPSGTEIVEDEGPAVGRRRFKRQRDKATEIDIPVFQGGNDGEIIDFKEGVSQDLQFTRKYRFSGIPPTAAEKDEIEVTFKYTKQQRIEVEAVYKPDDDNQRTELKGVDEDWDVLADEELLAGIKGGGAIVPLVVAIDCSGSMCGGKIDEAKKQLAAIADQHLHGGFSMSVVAFPHRAFGNAGEVVKGATEPDGIKRKLPDLVAGGGTPMGEGLALAHEVMKSVGQDAPMKFICLITDGIPRSKPLAKEAAEKIRQDGITLMGIPVSAGHEANDFIRSICEKYEKIDSAGGISQAFRNLMG